MTDRIKSALRRGAGDGGMGEATRRLTARALDDGLVSVAYATTDSPFVELLVPATPRGLVRVWFVPREGEDAVLSDLAERLSPRVLRAPERLDDARRQFDDYFDGRRK